ncbi:hypothetical protein GCM10010965_31710 [Caldalkalibacillus thermarum]|nr:hypothetical protein GCM10010965_31710 [Caldalkalibacillus thermarum]
MVKEILMLLGEDVETLAKDLLGIQRLTERCQAYAAPQRTEHDHLFGNAIRRHYRTGSGAGQSCCFIRFDLAFILWFVLAQELVTLVKKRFVAQLNKEDHG